jgi:uncharacterized protein (DUF608 family)
MKDLKNIKEFFSKSLNEKNNQWIVKDGIQMRKTLFKSMIAMNALDKAVKGLEQLDKKHLGKQNNEVFSQHIKGMRREADNFINGKYYKEWKEYEKTGKAIFGDHWND